MKNKISSVLEPTRPWFEFLICWLSGLFIEVVLPFQACVLIWLVKLRWDNACEVQKIGTDSRWPSWDIYSAFRKMIPRCLLGDRHGQDEPVSIFWNGSCVSKQKALCWDKWAMVMAPWWSPSTPSWRWWTLRSGLRRSCDLGTPSGGVRHDLSSHFWWQV